MSGRYDKDYQNVVDKLNEAFLKDRKDLEEDKKPLEVILLQNHKQMKELPGNEKKAIKDKLGQRIQNISYLDEKEKQLLEDVRENRKLNYKVTAWKMTGIVNMKKIMSAYTKLTQENETFRTVYLYREQMEPVRVVYEAKELTFPVHDLRNMSREKSNLIIRSVMAAESRREYNMETDAPCCIRGYLTALDELVAVVSIYPYLPYPMGMREMMYRIFPDMKMEADNIANVNDKTLRRMYEQLQAKSVEYWKGLLDNPGKRLTLPGEKTDIQSMDGQYRQRAILCKELGDKLTGQITEFAQARKISEQTVFLYVWAQILGRYHDENHPVLAEACNEKHLHIMPVRVDRTMSKEEALHALEEQLAYSKQFTGCTTVDIERATGIEFAQYFRMLQDFEGLNEKTEESFYTGDSDINLCVSYQKKEHNIIMNYVSRSGISEMMLDNIHELFLEILEELLQNGSTKFDKKTYIKIDDSDEERLNKLRLAQIALYLKNTGIFNTITVEGIMKLAEYCTLRTYLESDTIITEGIRSNMIYIIGDGRLEESRMDMEGMVKSLRIAKPGSVFGIESLFAGAAAHSTYTVVGAQARIVEIDRETFTEALRRKPEGWITLLEMENDQKCKLQRLWTME